MFANGRIMASESHGTGTIYHGPYQLIYSLTYRKQNTNESLIELAYQAWYDNYVSMKKRPNLFDKKRDR